MITSNTRHVTGWAAAALAALAIWGLVIVWPGTHAGARAADGPTTAELVTLWDAEHISPPLPPLLTHRDVVAHVTQMVARAPDLFQQETIGQSVEGRTLHHVWFGKGSMHVLLWSQMHGDEPTATAALFDLHHYVHTHRATPVVRRLLETLTIHVVPMLNPDGAERYQRRNAQDIDINRDAARLQTPEGRALKALRDRLRPSLGFNLHNQNWNTSVGLPPKPATISLLAVSFDRARSDNPGRILAKKVSAVIREAIEPLIPGQIGRYDDEFEVRAFGDNITKWGTPVVLIETGPAPGEDPDRVLIRTNFVALVTALDAVASGRVHKADAKRYETLPFNESRLLHTLVTNATLIAGTGVPPYVADIGIAGTRIVRRSAGIAGAGSTGASSTGASSAGASGPASSAGVSGAGTTSVAGTSGAAASAPAANGTQASSGPGSSDLGSSGPGSSGRSLGLSARIADLGDLQTSGALNAIDATGLTAAPLWDDAVKVGDEVSLPDWSGWKGPTVTIGQPANLLLLRPTTADAAGGGVAAAGSTAAGPAPAGSALAGSAPARSGATAARYRVERVIRLAEPERK